MPVHKNTIGEEYDELKAYCAVLENENDELEDELEKLKSENEKKDLICRSQVNSIKILSGEITQKNIEIEKLTKIIRAVEVIMGGKILED